jgi:hypothetical protein
MLRKYAGLVGLIVFTVLLLAACGATGSSVKSAVSSVAASVTATRTGATGQPTTAQPTTTAPTTAAPTTTPPTTAAPTTAATTPAAASTTAQGAAGGGGSTPGPTAATTPAPASSSGFPWAWFWLAVGIVAVAGLVIWAVAAHRRRSAAATDWRSRVIDAYAKGSALHDAMASAETPGALSGPDAGIRWSDIQRRADDYGQLLYAMEQEAPGEVERIQVADIIASLQAARSAMDAERSPGTPDSTLSGIVRDRIAFFASSVNSLREPNVRPA